GLRVFRGGRVGDSVIMTEASGGTGQHAGRRWDVALSFAGAQRDFVGQVARGICSMPGARAGSSAMAFRDAAAARATSVITAAVEASAHHVERRDSSLIHSPRTTPAKVG